MRTIVSGSVAALTFTAAALLAAHCEAQTLPWPTDRPAASSGTSPWPSGPPQAGGSAAAPAPAMAPMGAGPMTPVPPQAGPGPGGDGGPCMDEFTKLQTETDKRAKAAREGSARKAAREEMCKLMQSFEGALGKWAKYVKDNSSKCGIPPKIYEQLSKGHDNIAKSAKQVCDAGIGGAPGKPATPTLSDALGTTQIPTASTSRKAATGTFNTLTGTPLGQ